MLVMSTMPSFVPLIASDSPPKTTQLLREKKAKGIRSVSPEEPIDDHHGQIVRVAGSDAGWTDDMEAY